MIDAVAALNSRARHGQMAAQMIDQSTPHANRGIGAETGFARILKPLGRFDQSGHTNLDQIFDFKQITDTPMHLPGDFARKRHVQAHALRNIMLADLVLFIGQTCHAIATRPPSTKARLEKATMNSDRIRWMA